MLNPFIVRELPDETELHEEMNKVHRVPFDIATGPLHRFAIFSIGPYRMIMIVGHRILQLPFGY
jgi:hypothetical protein